MRGHLLGKFQSHSPSRFLTSETLWIHFLRRIGKTIFTVALMIAHECNTLYFIKTNITEQHLSKYPFPQPNKFFVCSLWNRSSLRLTGHHFFQYAQEPRNFRSQILSSSYASQTRRVCNFSMLSFSYLLVKESVESFDFIYRSWQVGVREIKYLENCNICMSTYKSPPHLHSKVHSGLGYQI